MARRDHGTRPGQLHQRTDNPEHVIATVLADAGYASDANLAAPGPDPADRLE
jgi:hypothetical protein